jgi:hypothetical protein
MILKTCLILKGNLSPMILDIFKFLSLFRDKIGTEAVLSFIILFSSIKDTFRLLYVTLQNFEGSILK